MDSMTLPLLSALTKVAKRLPRESQTRKLPIIIKLDLDSFASTFAALDSILLWVKTITVFTLGI